MYLIVDLYGVVYKASNINNTLEDMTEEGDITIIDIQGCDNPKVFEVNAVYKGQGKWLNVELQEN